MLFSFELSLDFLEFSVDCIVMSGGAVDFDHCLAGFFGTASSICITRGLGEEKNTNAENESIGPAHADDDSPACRAVALMLVGAEVETRS